jgi:transposase
MFASILVVPFLVNQFSCYCPKLIFNFCPSPLSSNSLSTLAGSKRQRCDGEQDERMGGAPLDVALKENIIHMYYDLLMTPEEIAPLIKSPRRAGGVAVSTVNEVLTFFQTWYHVGKLPRGAKRLKMPDAHVEMLLEIVKATPWLYLDEISEELQRRCSLYYRPGYCFCMLERKGYSLKVMRRVARQRDENKRFEYFLAVGKIMSRPSQLVFADEVGQDGRGSRRRRGWGGVGTRVDIPEFLNRGKHISILALYGIGGFIDFDYVEGGYKAEDFLTAVEYMIIPHLRPYPEDNSIFVLDNCQIHHKYAEQLRDMVEAVGAKLLFLAPYRCVVN